MKKFLLLLLLLSLAPVSLSAQDGYLEVTAPGNRALQLAIAPPVATAGSRERRYSQANWPNCSGST